MAKNKESQDSLFKRLTRLFRGGPVIKRKVRTTDTTMAVPDREKSSGALLFQKSLSPTYATITSNAYNLSERLMRYQDFCFTGDTLVATDDETGYTRIDELVKRWESGDTNISTFSYDVVKKSIVSSRITGAKCNGVRRVITVKLDDGTEIRCTPDHRFMLGDSSYAEAQDLKPGTMLMSCTNEFRSLVSLEDRGEEELVYDIEVKGYSNFSIAKKVGIRAQGVVIVHNCEMEYCLHGDTKIAIPGGYKTISELAQECEGKPDHKFIVYSYDHNLKRIIPALGKQARLTRTDDAYTVTFDNGQKIIGTSNHRLMKRDGTFCMIEDLKPGDAMMPFYRRDLFNGCKEEGDGYRWIYTMDRRSKMNGWVAEHRVIGELLKGSPLEKNEVVHHKNFIKFDNNPNNLVVMTDVAHKKLHTEILNGVKWSEQNSDWIQQFKINHSKFMTENNPAERKDITFGRILEIAERTGFNSRKICEVLDTDPNAIKRRLRKHGYQDFQTFAKAYNPDWCSSAWDNRGEKNPRYNRTITFDKVCSHFSKGMTKDQLAKSLGTTTNVIIGRIREQGYKSYAEFSNSYENLKVVSIEYFGVIPLYDLTVDGYKNFATDSVISHNTAELAAALDIYADETVASDDKGRVLHIYSDNPKIKSLLQDLFYNTLNVEFNMRSWVRNLVKFGDFFLFNDVSPEHGVINAFPIPVNEIEREENYDRADPSAVRFRWVTLGNRILENWEISHFRLLGNDMFLPYGSSIIEPARRIWRQLILIEDAMLVYRVVRAPERRVFYIDVGGMPAEAVTPYVEEQKRALKSSQVIDRNTGRVDLRYNPLSVDEDYFIAVRGGDSGTKIDTLAGGQNTAAIEDVEYIQKKLFAALKIPKAYLGYDEALSSKATLAQEDIRFSRTISVIQKTVIAELNKLAIIHLYANGYDSEDLLNFTLRLSNPSTVAQQQKLELWRSKFDIASTGLTDGIASKTFVRREILGLSDEDCRRIDQERFNEKIVENAIEEAAPGGESPEGGGGSSGGGGGGGELDDLFGSETGEEEGGGEEEPEAEGGTEEPENAGEEEVEDMKLLTSNEEDEDALMQVSSRSRNPVRINPNVRGKKNQEADRYNRSRHVKNPMSDLRSMLNPHNIRSSRRPGRDNDEVADKDFFRGMVTNPLGEDASIKPSLSTDVVRMLKKMSVTSRNDLLTEEFDLDIMGEDEK